jgi:hypothetical protein
MNADFTPTIYLRIWKVPGTWYDEIQIGIFPLNNRIVEGCTVLVVQYTECDRPSGTLHPAPYVGKWQLLRASHMPKTYAEGRTIQPTYSIQYSTSYSVLYCILYLFAVVQVCT